MKFFKEKGNIDTSLQAQECKDLYKAHGLTDQTITVFQQTTLHYYDRFKRLFPWRKNINPYRVVVSEVMLQQTQTFRVAQKFDLFVTKFSNFHALAHAPFDAVRRQTQACPKGWRLPAGCGVASLGRCVSIAPRAAPCIRLGKRQ